MNALFLSGLFLFLEVSSSVLAQTGEKPAFPEVHIFISNDQAADLREITGEKSVLSHPVLLINGDTVPAKEIHVRGASTLHFTRKSLSIDLDHAFHLRIEGDTVKLKKFDLLNLAMDKNLWHNRWAFLNLAELDLFPLFNRYCKVWINKMPQGIYLLVEKPNSGFLKSPYMIRRGPSYGIAHEYNNTKSDEDARKYKQQYLGIYKDIGKFDGTNLSEHLRSAFDLDHYFEWLAFNYLIMNGDYADELYFYIRPHTDLFDIVPWDYDDIFMRGPHEGTAARQKKLTDKLIFSIEDQLDRKIAADTVLYRQYLVAYRKLLLNRDNTAIGRTFDQVLNELRILAEDLPSAKASTYMEQDPFIIENASKDMTLMKAFLVHRRNTLVKASDK